MRSVFILAFASALLGSCTEHTCHNSMQVFDANPPESAEYRKALIQLIRGDKGNSLQYIFDRYVEQDGKKYLSINIYEDSICAKALVEVHDSYGIEKLVRNKGLGYSGSELVDLRLTVADSATNPRLVYSNLAFIID